MKTLYVLLLGLITSTLLTSCGHTNNLAKYDVAGKTALFRSWSSTSGSSTTVVESPDNESIIADIASIVGSGVMSDQAQKKLRRAINTDSIADAVAQGMWQSTSDYLGVREVKSMADDPDFIVETELTQFKLISNSGGMNAQVCAKSRIIDRRSGGVVWENSEAHTINVSNTFPAIFGPDAVRSGASVFNAVQLLNMDEEDIRKVINEAARQAGREIGETLREDVADLHEK
ncbi:MAG: hypothetical protein KDD67_09590 [Ignavibacteriae bacterium]|nr:hypothetical protein [Ignavibacteriota bacterium]